jgi:hypothetical protein
MRSQVTGRACEMRGRDISKDATSSPELMGIKGMVNQRGGNQTKANNFLPKDYIFLSTLRGYSC